MHNYIIGQRDKYGADVHEIVNVIPAHMGAGDITIEEKVSAYPHHLVCDAGVIRLKSEAEKAQDERAAYVKRRTAEIYAELERIDKQSIRPVRAGETERLAELDAQAQALRDELSGLYPR